MQFISKRLIGWGCLFFRAKVVAQMAEGCAVNNYNNALVIW